MGWYRIDRDVVHKRPAYPKNAPLTDYEMNPDGMGVCPYGNQKNRALGPNRAGNMSWPKRKRGV